MSLIFIDHAYLKLCATKDLYSKELAKKRMCLLKSIAWLLEKVLKFTPRALLSIQS